MLISDIILCLLKSIISVVFAERFGKRKHSFDFVLGIILLILVCGGIDIIAVSLPLWARCIISLTTLFISCVTLFKMKAFLAFSTAVTCIYIRIASELTVNCLLLSFMREDFTETVYGTELNRTIFGIISIVIAAGLLKLIVYILMQQPFESSAGAWRHYSFVNFVFVAVSALFGSLFKFDESNKDIAPMIAAVAVLMLAMSIVVINFFAEICAAYEQEKQFHHLRTDYGSLKEQFQVQFRTTQRLKKVRHDIKNHLINISSLIGSEKYDEACELLREISDAADSLQPALSQSSGNSLIDAVITYKAAVCEIKNIQFDYTLELLPEIKIELSDISSVLSNLLDNAIESAEKSDDPFVSIKIFMYKDYLTVIVKNRFYYVPNTSDGKIPTAKKDKENHGLGMTIVSEACERNCGVFRHSTQGAWFKASAMLRNK